MEENQKSVTEWCNEHYPNINNNEMLKSLVEETVELSVSLGDITLEEIIEVATNAWNNLSHDIGNREYIASGVADVQIITHLIASENSISVQKALGDKMKKNRNI